MEDGVIVVNMILFGMIGKFELCVFLDGLNVDVVVIDLVYIFLMINFLEIV